MSVIMSNGRRIHVPQLRSVCSQNQCFHSVFYFRLCLTEVYPVSLKYSLLYHVTGVSSCSPSCSLSRDKVSTMTKSTKHCTGETLSFICLSDMEIPQKNSLNRTSIRIKVKAPSPLKNIKSVFLTMFRYVFLCVELKQSNVLVHPCPYSLSNVRPSICPWTVGTLMFYCSRAYL